MWSKIANTILLFRITFMVILGLITLFMGYQCMHVKWSYSLASTVPEKNSDMLYFKEFKNLFGDDNNFMAIGLHDSAIYELKNFEKYSELITTLNNKEGIQSILGLPNLKRLEKNNQKQTFELKPLFETIPKNQKTLDSLLKEASKLKLYSNQLINPVNGATISFIAIQKEIILSSNRDILIKFIVDQSKKFESETGITIHFAGFPYARSIISTEVKKELNVFLFFSLMITGLILFLFFRSLRVVLYTLIIIGMVVIWSLGTLALLDYKITLLTGLIPSIIVVIGIPNSVYMINKYHREYNTHGDQIKAMINTIKKIGIVIFITNLTTAVGFLVLTTTNIKILAEFGSVIGIHIMSTFVVSIILIPSIFSLFPPPSKKNLKYLKLKKIDWIIKKIDVMVHTKRLSIFVVTLTIIVFSIVELNKIEVVSYMVDDLPENNPLKKDLKFFEDNFSGIMPLEIVIDTGHKKGAQSLKNLQKVDNFEKSISSIEYISPPISIVGFTKTVRQAFYKQNEAFYSLPTTRDMGFIMNYLRDNDNNNEFNRLAQSFVDSTGRYLRISLKIADIGSNKLDSLVNNVIQPKIDSVFSDSKLKATITGSTFIFIKGNKFLIENLFTSIVIAFFIISLIISLLFKNIKMILISVIPNIIPLLITGGIMAFFGIPLKPSTVLIFSIVFGISVDDSIHFLTKYRQELFANNFNVSKAISKSIHETGSSMIYTSTILFFGFLIFVFSQFGGTVALGKLISITLFFALITNVVLLPAIILQFDNGKYNKKIHPPVEHMPELAEGINNYIEPKKKN